MSFMHDSSVPAGLNAEPRVVSPTITPVLRLDALGSTKVSAVTLALMAGDSIAIVGQSGSGKSLLLRQIADLDSGQGTAYLNSTDRAAMRGFEWRRQVMYCQAEAGWWDESVAAHFGDIDAARTIAARLGVTVSRLEAQVLTLSTGERQRLALVRSLLLSPRVLLLDEPTAALDEHATTLVEQELQRFLQRGGCMILVTHNMAQAHRCGQKVFRMDAGILRPL